MSYSERLTDPKWQKRRLEILQRDNWKCTYCGNDKIELQVHHVDYIPGIKVYEYPDDMLKTLCIECHQNENNREKLEVNLSNTLKMKGFMIGDLLSLSCLIDTNKKFTESLLKMLRNG